MQKLHIYRYFILFLLAAVMGFTACSSDDNPVDPSDTDHDHAEAEGLVISSGDQELVRYQEGNVSGEITIATGAETPELTLQFIASDGDLFVPDGDHHGLNFEIADSGIADLILQDVEGIVSNKFHVKGVAAGATGITIKIMHGDHADFVSPAIPVTVTE